MKRAVTVLILILILALAIPAFTMGAFADGENSGLFSGRDLSGSYADEVFHITLNGTTAASDTNRVSASGGIVTVSGPGTYLVSGALNNGSIVVNADKQDKVQLVLDGVTVHSDSYAAIYVAQADKVFVTLADGTSSTLTNGGSFTQTDDNKVDAVIFSKDDLTLNGSGSLAITSPAGHGIVGKDDVTITGGSYAITSSDSAITTKDSLNVADGSFVITTGEDGLHAENNDDNTKGSICIEGGSFLIKAGDDAIHATTLLQIDGGSIDITAAEGMEATYVLINDGCISITATDDGVNAARKSSAYTSTVEINGGELNVTMGPGDTDGIDSNGNIVITGGTVNVTGNSAFDYDGSASFTGGTVIINGQQVDSLPNQMMGGRGGMMGGHGNILGGLGSMTGGPGDMAGNRGGWMESGQGMHDRKGW